MEWLTALIVGFTAFISALGGAIAAIRRTKKQLEESFPDKLKRQNGLNVQIIEHLEDLKEILKADRVQVYDFHNGEHFANGRSALKVSCTYEAVRQGVKSFQRELQAVPMSCIPHFINQLVNDEKVIVHDLNDIKTTMPGTFGLKESDAFEKVNEEVDV